MFVKRLILIGLKKVRMRFSPLLLGLVFFSGSLSAESWSWNGVYLIQPETLEYSGPVQIQVQDGLVEKISPSSPGKEPLYILPGFCDSHVTLGANSLGGQKDKNELELDLKQFLLHGFTHIQSVADPAWATELSESRKKNFAFPKILTFPPVLLADSKEVAGAKPTGYKILKSPEEAIAAVSSRGRGRAHLFLRHNEGEAFTIDGKLLYRMRSEAEKVGLELSVSTFGEEFANWEALSSEVKVLYHPIPEMPSLQPVAGNLIKQIWAPLFSIYYAQKEIGTSSFSQEWEKWTEWSPSFKERAMSKEALSTFTPLSESEKQEADREYDSYLAFLRARKNLSLRILLGSGSGHQFLFPGISGWKELRILSDLIGPKEALRAATETTCSYLGAAHEGKIRVGKPAHLLIFREDPLKNWDKLKTLKTVVTERVKTEIAAPSSPEKKKEKKKSKSGKKT
ncbi:hypothetical protein EHO59_06270 [Leptospira semungkisensis]|uniref:Amidohydrolase-related domain-containing protein n=1 Tax=Leptospira semungkisensis TaxID=2484985 RepID=A0A4R9G867_9LEPT|nr:hypothetical protein [Leptospira semungkisensis]TGK07703.1 hypothetical protein EHO59_06270 [Leptospira semungkisensis]